jgi:hypothetical protein
VVFGGIKNCDCKLTIKKVITALIDKNLEFLEFIVKESEKRKIGILLLL